LETPNKKQNVKRDPILQDNNEPTKEFKPSKRPMSAERTAPPKEEVRAKARGDFNHVYNPRSDEEKPQGIKAFVVMPPQSTDENPRRISKGVRHKSELRQRNPLVEGDAASMEIRRSKRPVTPTSDHQKMNEKKFLLPAERGASPQGKLFRDSTFNVGEMEFASMGSQTERYTSTPSRPITPMETKMRGHIKGVLEYEGGPNYRDHVISDKCQTIKFVDILKAHEPSNKVFARKKTLEY